MQEEKKKGNEISLKKYKNVTCLITSDQRITKMITPKKKTQTSQNTKQEE